MIVVLCRPEKPGNIGAICRVMKNMGLNRLRLAAYEGTGRDDEIIRVRAVHASEIWENAERFPNLEAALADCAFTVGTSRRMGRRRKGYSLNPEEAAARFEAHPGPGALVFGNEQHGLDDRELGLCDFTSHIPSSEDFPSLNLSHAAQIYAYELFKTLGSGESPGVRRWVPLAREGLDGLTQSITDSLASLGFYKQKGREEQTRFFREIFARAGLTQREGEYLSMIFAKASRLASQKFGGSID